MIAVIPPGRQQAGHHKWHEPPPKRRHDVGVSVGARLFVTSCTRSSSMRRSRPARMAIASGSSPSLASSASALRSRRTEAPTPAGRHALRESGTEPPRVACLRPIRRSARCTAKLDTPGGGHPSLVWPGRTCQPYGHARRVARRVRWIFSSRRCCNRASAPAVRRRTTGDATRPNAAKSAGQRSGLISTGLT